MRLVPRCMAASALAFHVLVFCGVATASTATLGCTSTTYVTPWFRTRVRSSSLSLGHGPSDLEKWIERRDHGRWVATKERRDGWPVAFARGTRVLGADRIFREDGPPLPLRCRSLPRVDPSNDSELVCVEWDPCDGLQTETSIWCGTYALPDRVTVSRLDRDGKLLSTRSAALPSLSPVARRAFASWHFVGFVATGLVFSSLAPSKTRRRGDSSPTLDSAGRECEAYRLAPDGEWTSLGLLRDPNGYLDGYERCTYPPAWNRERRLGVRFGQAVHPRPRTWSL